MLAGWQASTLAGLGTERELEHASVPACKRASGMKYLIVNADDFGACASVNRGVLEAHRHGIVSSATILANTPGFEEAAAMAREAPELGVGVHLNLTGGRALSLPARIPTLVRADGTFAHTPGALALALLRGRVALADVEREWGAQIARVRDAGIAPTHLDGHKHVHLLPPLLRVSLRLARECGIRALRAGAEPGVFTRLAPADPQWYKTCVLSVLGPRARRTVVAAGQRAPDRILGVLDGGRLDSKRLERLLTMGAEGVTELMCHPGYDSPELRRLQAQAGEGYRVAAREVEVRALTAPGLRRILRERGITLIHYGML